jgi:small subunit ribosomal protein S1
VEGEGEPGSAPGFGEALEAFEQGQAKEPAPAAPAPGRAKARAKRAHKLGDLVQGRIVSVSEEVLLLDIGARAEAVADAREFRGPDGQLTVSVGDTLELHVVQAGESLTLARAAPRRPKRSVEALRQARESGLPVRGRVVAVNPGGLTIDVDGVRAFCPLSQIDEQHVEDPAPYVGRRLEFLVTEVEASRSRAVLSRRRLLTRQRAEAAKSRLASLAAGQEMDGSVTRLEPYGAFVDLGGIEGLVHVSEISRDRLAHPRDALAAGDKVRVRVIEVERGKGGRPRVALSIRALAPDPWEGAAARFAVGSRVSGVVVRLADFGAFVNLAPGIDGLVHVSQASDHRITHVREVLSTGQAVEAIVLSLEPERRRVSLSIRDARMTDPGRSQVVEREGEAEASTPGADRERNLGGARPPRRRAGGERRGRGPERPRDEGRRERGRSGREGARSERPAAPSRESSSRGSEPPALTTMQLAFQRARERQRERER